MQDSYDFCSSENVRVGSKAPEPVQDAAAAYASHVGIAAYIPPGPLCLEFLCLGVELNPRHSLRRLT